MTKYKKRINFPQDIFTQNKKKLKKKQKQKQKQKNLVSFQDCVHVGNVLKTLFFTDMIYTSSNSSAL